MALDVHVVDDPGRDHCTGFPSYQFDEHVHGYIFHGCGIDIYSKYAFLRRMIDYYADAHYTGDALDRVVADIDDLAPQLSSHQPAIDALNSFRQICVEARAAGKSVFLFCD